MPRAVALNLLASAVTVLAAIAFLGAGMLGGSPPPAGPSPAAAVDGPDGGTASDAPLGGTEAVVRTFYAAVNAAIHTGDVAALDAIVAPDAVVHAALPGGTPDKSSLIDYLTSVHASGGTAELVVDELSAIGDGAMAHVTERVSAPASFLARALDEPPPVWGRRDAFRVAGDRVAEFWSDLGGYVLIDPVGRVRLDAPRSTGRDLVLERVRLRPDHAWRASPVPRAIAVIAGRLAIAVDPWSSAFPVRFFAAAGEAADLPLSGRYVLLPADSSPSAMVVALAIPATADAVPLRPGSGATVAAPSSNLPNTVPAEPTRGGADGRRDAAVERFASGPAVGFANGRVGVSFARVTVGPGGTLRIPAADDAVLLGIESGRLAVMTENGAVKLNRGSAGSDSDEFAASGRLVVGDGAYVPPSVVVTLHNPGTQPAVVLAAGVEP